MSELLAVGNLKDGAEYVEHYQLQTQKCVQLQTQKCVQLQAQQCVQQLQQPRNQPSESQEYWVFGYGSLIWKPPIAWEKRVPGYIRGYVRRFWQHSVDHRGTIEKPGRVVTLVPHSEWKLLNDYHDHREDDVTWGVAYKIPSHCAKEVKDYLDCRESGYATKLLDVYQEGKTQPVIRQAVCYIATPQSSDYCGPAPFEDIIHQIFSSRGASGPNIDYALNLAKALRSIAPDSFDPHVYDLERGLLELEASRSNSWIMKRYNKARRRHMRGNRGGKKTFFSFY